MNLSDVPTPDKDTALAMKRLLILLLKKELFKLHLKIVSHVTSSVSTPNIQLASARRSSRSVQRSGAEL